MTEESTIVQGSTDDRRGSVASQLDGSRATASSVFSRAAQTASPTTQAPVAGPTSQAPTASGSAAATPVEAPAM